ncbi:1945_t:CDS:2, partial [Gigaspora margarita]
MADLNFVIDDSNEIDREEESQRVDKSLKEVKESLEQFDDKLIEGFKQADDKLRDDFKQACDKIDDVTQHIDFMQSTKQGDEKNNIDPGEFDDPKKQINREKLFKKLYESTIEVACKLIPIDGQNENRMAILSKLNLSPQILIFYGHSVANNSQVLRDLSVKLGNFGFERKESYGRNAVDISRPPPVYIVRWMAPELIKKKRGITANPIKDIHLIAKCSEIIDTFTLNPNSNFTLIMSGKEFFDTADVLSVYIPVIDAMAEFSMEKIIRNIEKEKENFRDKSYYLAFERFKNNLTQIKEFTKSVSKLKGYKSFLHAIDVKNKFDQLRNDLDK